MAFRTVVTDALDEWDELLRERVQTLRRSDPSPDGDEFRYAVLKELHENRYVSFRHWRAEEILIFVLVAFPRAELLKLTASGRVSKFFVALHEKWHPSFANWIHVIWRFTGHAHEFFSDVLFLMPPEQKAPFREMGRVLFRELIQKEIMPPETAVSVIGVLIEWPLERTMVNVHAEQLYSFTLLLTPDETGFLCRSLIMYRAKELNNECDCGYGKDEHFCKCASRYIRNNYRGKKGIDLEHDRDKEYACALCRIIIEKHAEHGRHVEKFKWTDKEKEEFLMSACDEVFSEQIYIELFQNLNVGRMPRLRQRRPRALSHYELNHNALRSTDSDYHHGFAQHAGCVAQNCKQAWKTGCQNTSCNTHCFKNGLLECRPHRNYEPLGLPTYNPRRNIHFRKTELENSWVP